MIKLTLDTNCLINHFDVRSTTATSREQIASLIRLATSGRAEIALTTRAETDIEQDRDETRRAEMLRVLGMFEVVGSILRWDESSWDGGDLWADGHATVLADEIRKVLFPGLRSNDSRFGNKIRDVDHIVGHVLARRDVFVTDDRRILQRAEPLRRLGAVIMPPADCLLHVEGGDFLGLGYTDQEVITLQDVITPGVDSTITFDCAAGRNFRVKLSRPAALMLPLNPRPGTYRLQVEQGDDARGILAVSAKYDWVFADHSDLMVEGDVSIYQIEIVAASDGYAYFGTPVFQSKKVPPSTIVEPHAMSVSGGALMDGSGGEGQMRFERARAGCAKFRWSPNPSGRFRWRVHWTPKSTDEGLSALFRLSALGPSDLAVEIVATARRGWAVQASQWSSLSKSQAYGVQVMRLERVVADERDTIMGPVDVAFIELQAEPRPG